MDSVNNRKAQDTRTKYVSLLFLSIVFFGAANVFCLPLEIEQLTIRKQALLTYIYSSLWQTDIEMLDHVMVAKRNQAKEQRNDEE